jgi:hypothetical protein
MARAMSEMLVRFLVGGCVVSAFATLGDILRPKSFAGLFGAAPSVALASLGLALLKHGNQYAATQALAMISGAVALGVYSIVVCRLLMVGRLRALTATMEALLLWLAVALSLLFMLGPGT